MRARPEASGASSSSTGRDCSEVERCARRRRRSGGGTGQASSISSPDERDVVIGAPLIVHLRFHASRAAAGLDGRPGRRRLAQPRSALDLGAAWPADLDPLMIGIARRPAPGGDFDSSSAAAVASLVPDPAGPRRRRRLKAARNSSAHGHGEDQGAGGRASRIAAPPSSRRSPAGARRSTATTARPADQGGVRSHPGDPAGSGCVGDRLTVGPSITKDASSRLTGRPSHVRRPPRSGLQLRRRRQSSASRPVAGPAPRPP